MSQKVQHIDIPFDEMEIFKLALLLTTLGNITFKNKEKKVQIYITAKSLWVKIQHQLIKLIPANAIVAIIKSKSHPEIILITDRNWDNILITTTSEDRCWYIISSISYIFSYILHRPLDFYSLNLKSLCYFERSSSQKRTDNHLNLAHYKKQQLTYKKPFKNTSVIYGSLKNSDKIILQKQIEIQLVNQQYGHLVYVAKIKQQPHHYPNSQFFDVSDSSPDNRISLTNGDTKIKQQKFMCHYVQKKIQYLQMIHNHKNLNFVEKMIYAKQTDFKIQILFQLSNNLRGMQIDHKIFLRVWQLYDLAKEIDSGYVLTTDSLLITQPFENGVIKLKQFRYAFLSQTSVWDEFIFSLNKNFQSKYKIHQQDGQELKQNQNQKQKDSIFLQLQNKMYNIGMVLYQLVTGMNLLAYSPAFVNQDQFVHEQTVFIYEVKDKIRKGEIEIFPKYLKINIHSKFKDFIAKLITGKFKDEQEVLEHEWIKTGKSRSQNSSS